MQLLIRNATIVNEGTQQVSDILIKDGRIDKIQASINTPGERKHYLHQGIFLYWL